MSFKTVVDSIGHWNKELSTFVRYYQNKNVNINWQNCPRQFATLTWKRGSHLEGRGRPWGGGKGKALGRKEKSWKRGEDPWRPGNWWGQWRSTEKIYFFLQFPHFVCVLLLIFPFFFPFPFSLPFPLAFFSFFFFFFFFFPFMALSLSFFLPLPFPPSLFLPFLFPFSLIFFPSWFTFELIPPANFIHPCIQCFST